MIAKPPARAAAAASAVDTAASDAGKPPSKPVAKRSAKAMPVPPAKADAVQPPAKPAPGKSPAPARQRKAAPLATPAAAAHAAAKPLKAKEKLVRDSFTMPRSDFALIQQLKDRAMGFHHAPKKSELLRAGLHALAGLSDAALQAQLKTLPTLKSGRPRKAG